MKVSTTNPNFTKENHQAWGQFILEKEIFFKKFANFIYPPYLDGYSKLNLNIERIPTIESLTRALSPSGWLPIYVDGYLPTKTYMGFLLNKKIPISTYVRSLNHIRYAPAPDLIHDLIGHLPMLFFREYTDYLLKFSKCYSQTKPTIIDNRYSEAQEKLARLSNNPLDNLVELQKVKKEVSDLEKTLNEHPSTQYKLGRLFLWTIEFGLIKNNSISKIYGSGLISSSLEAEAICQGKIRILPFLLDNVLKKFHFSDLQEHVFVVDSFETLNDCLSVFKEHLLEEFF